MAGEVVFNTGLVGSVVFSALVGGNTLVGSVHCYVITLIVSVLLLGQYPCWVSALVGSVHWLGQCPYWGQYPCCISALLCHHPY